MKVLKLILRTKDKEKVVEIKADENSTYEDIIRPYFDFFIGQVVLASENNKLFELGEKISGQSEEIIFYDTINTDGNRVYMRSLSFIFIKAINEIYKNERVIVEHTISNGLYCTIRDGNRIITIDSNTRDLIKSKMEKLIGEDIKISKEEVSLKDAMEMFEKLSRQDKQELLHYRTKDRVLVYKLGDYIDYFYGHMVPSTGYIKTFSLEIFDHGIVLVGMDKADKNKSRNFIPDYKLSQVYNEAEAWAEMQGITNVSKLNKCIENEGIGDVCMMSEALQQHKIMKLAEEIHKNNKRIILIAAPSSSGKTSFAYRLKTSLRVLGLRPISISLDDYYVDREDTPLDENGNFDFESLYSIDLERFNDDLSALINGSEIERIRFDFIQGKRVSTGEKISLKGSNPVIIEGIHGLNPKLTDHIDDSFKYKIYLSVITQINLDDHNRIPTTDLRLLRRMARDKHFRGKNVRETILEWPSVREGERKNIFPYQDQADVMFNSSFAFDISALKPIIIEDLEKISQDDPAYTEAARLKSFLQYFIPLKDTSYISNTSILREFIGGSKIV